MGGCIKPIGGELWYQPSYYHHEKDNFKGSELTYLSSGQSALRYILTKLKLSHDDIVLIPSYICPSIVKTLNHLT